MALYSMQHFELHLNLENMGRLGEEELLKALNKFIFLENTYYKQKNSNPCTRKNFIYFIYFKCFGFFFFIWESLDDENKKHDVMHSFIP